MARGRQRAGVDVPSMEMVKWFDSNYHYTKPSFSDSQTFALAKDAKPVREFLEADLVDTLHVAVAEGVTLGAGAKLWDSPDELLDRFHCDVVPSPTGAVRHHLFWRK